MTIDERDLTGFGLAALAALGLSLKAILIKLAYRIDPDPLLWLTLRMTVAAIIVDLIAFAQHGRGPRVPLSTRETLWAVALGLLGLYLPALLDFEALRTLSVDLERLTLSLWPTFVVAIMVWRGGGRPTRMAVFSIVMSYAGLWLLLHGSPAASTNPGHTAMGIALVLMAAFSFAGSTVASVNVIQRMGGLRFTAITTTSSALAFVAQDLATRRRMWPDLSLRGEVIGWALAIVSTVVPTLAQTRALALIGASNVAAVNAAGPLLTVLLASAVLDERLTIGGMLGVGVMVIGVYALLTRGRRQTATWPAPPGVDATGGIDSGPADARDPRRGAR